MPRYGFALQIPNRSLTSVLLVEPTAGVDLTQPSTDLPPGSIPYSENFIFREGAIEPRATLTYQTGNPTPLQARVTGGMEVMSTTGIRYPVVSYVTSMAWFSNNSWSELSYVSAGGVNNAPSGSSTSLWDATQIYYALRDENLAVFANGSYQTLYCWESNTTVFSTLTGAPRAKYITAFDNYLLAFNIRDTGSVESTYPQRVQWSDRGSASSWTQGLAGFEELLAMRGEGTRIMAQDNRVILFSDKEIWQGYPSAFPSVFRFEPYDRTVGCPYPWTASDTPIGIIFLARNLQTYLLPKAGGPATPIGHRFWRELRETLQAPEQAWAVYDHQTDHYQLYYRATGDAGISRAVYLNLTTGAWAPQRFDPINGTLALSRGFPVTGVAESSSATSWDGMAGFTWDGAAELTWDSLGTVVSSPDRRDLYIGSEYGTIYLFDSNGTGDRGEIIVSGNTVVRTPCLWRSPALWAEAPGQQKTVTEWRADYESPSASSLTVRFSTDHGASFALNLGVNVRDASIQSQVVAHPYIASRFPMFQIESDGFRYRLFRFLVTARLGGR